MNIQNKFKKTNTIYKITKDMDLEGSTLIIPVGCTLDFQGGSFKNGTINFNDTILSGDIKILTNIFGNINNRELHPEWFGAKGDGMTDDTKIIQAIINLNPKKISFPSNRIFFVSNLQILNSLKIEGNGSTLLFNTNCYATVNYHASTSSNVSNIEWVSSSPRVSKIYINNTSSYKKGNIIKIYSDDLIEGTEFKQSQYFIVGNVYSNYIEVTGKVIFNFTTNIKIQLIDSSKKLEVNNLVLSSLKHTYYNDRGLFTIIGGAYHNIKDCCVKNTSSHGFLFAGSYGYNVDNLELDYSEFINTVPQSIGMGVCDSASSNFTISFKGGYTQAFTCVYFSENDYPETYGVSQFGNIKNSVAAGSALDNHTNCYNLIYSDSIISSSENGIVIRGGRCIYDNISVNAAIYGLYVYADSHNTGNSIDFLVRNTNIYSHTRCVQIENNKEFKIKGVVENCLLEGRTAAIHLKNADITFRNCTITGLITISNNVNVIFDNCTINGYINIAQGIIDSNVIIRNSIVNASNNLSFRECPATIENTTINIDSNYYILITLATNIVFSKVTFNTNYQYLLRTQNSAVVELNDCIINHTGVNPEFHVFRTIGITIDVILKTIFNNLSIYNKASQSTVVYLSYVDSWKGGSSINNRVKSVYVDNSLLDGVYICNRTDKIMVVNDILDNPYYIERGDINTDGTLKDKEVIVYRVEDIVPGLTDTIYKIVKDIDLNGTSKGIPANCTLDFQGGSISNGTIIGNETKIEGNVKIECFLLGTYKGNIDGCWFIHDVADNTDELQNFFNLLSANNIGFFSRKVDVKISSAINVKSNTSVDFENCFIYQLSNSAVLANKARSTTYDNINISISNLHMYNTTTNVISMGAIIMRGVKNLKIENFYYTSNVTPPDPKTRNWALTISGIDIYMNNINIDNYITGIWSDGIHFEYVKRLILTNFNIKSGDDCIAINPQDTADKLGGYLPNVNSNIVISNGICASNRGNILRIGAGGDTISPDYYVENVTVNNITVTGEGTNPLISLQDFRTIVPNNLNNNILISNIRGTANATGNTKTIAIEGTYLPAIDYVWNNIVFENFNLTTEGTGTRIRVYNTVGIVFKDCTINLKGDTEINPYKILSRSTKFLTFKGCTISSNQNTGRIIRLSNNYEVSINDCNIFNYNETNTSIAIDIADISETNQFSESASNRILKVQDCIIKGVGSTLEMPTDDIILFGIGQFKDNILIDAPNAVSTILNHFNDLNCGIKDIILLANTLPAITSVKGLRLGTYTYDLNLHRPKFAGVNTDNTITYYDAYGYTYGRVKGSTDQRPSLTNTDAGFQFYDNVLKKTILWNGTAWTNLDGTVLT